MVKTSQAVRAIRLAGIALAVAFACALGVAGSAAAAETGGSTPLTVQAPSLTTQASSNGLVDGHVYVIKSALKSDYALDISGASKANGANAQMYAFNATNAQQ